MNEKLVVQQAQLNDKLLIEEMLKQAAKWLHKKGSNQWSGILKGEDRHDTLKAIKRGEVFIGKVDNRLVGMFVFWSHQSEWDEEFWGKDTSDVYLYLHRLVVERSHSGKGIAEQLLFEAKKYAKAKDFSVIRLDCIADNVYLNKLYQNAGFCYKGKKLDVLADGARKDFNLYECDINNQI